MIQIHQQLKLAIAHNVNSALAEDLMTGDIHHNLFDPKQIGQATIITREASLCCGRPWVDLVFSSLDQNVRCHWLVDEGDIIQPNQVFVEIEGPINALLSGERTALNFLQTLMGTANQCHELVAIIQHTNAKLLDTRKTIPGLRYAQKYAVAIAGGINHRMGLWDEFMLKENHIQAAGTIDEAVKRARAIDINKFIEVEVENLIELELALAAQVNRIMLDNFKPAMIRQAIQLRDQQAYKTPFEASGNISKLNILEYAETGIEYISTGTITKNCQAVDLSFRL